MLTPHIAGANGQVCRALNVGKGYNETQDHGSDYLLHSSFTPVLSFNPRKIPGAGLVFSSSYKGGTRLAEDTALRRTKLVGSGSLFSQYTQASTPGT